MNPETRSPSRTEVVEEASKWGVGAGIVVVALFPLAIPILILTAAALLPLVVPLLALALLAGVVALPVLVLRRLAKSVGRLRRPRAERPRHATRPAAEA